MESPVPTAPRTTADRFETAKRMVIALGALLGTCALFALTLPALRAAMLPAPPVGGWVLGPSWLLRLGACAVLSSLALPFLLRPLALRWRARDLAARGAPIDPLASMPGWRVRTLIQGGLLLVVYGVCGAFYFASYTEVDGDRYVVHSLLGARSYSYDRMAALELHPARGDMAERYAIRFDDGSWGYFSTDCEGTTADEIARIAAAVAQRTGLTWVMAPRD